MATANERPQRVLLQMRVAPRDADKFVKRAEEEVRSYGEMLSILLRESESAREEREAVARG